MRPVAIEGDGIPAACNAGSVTSEKSKHLFNNSNSARGGEIETSPGMSFVSSTAVFGALTAAVGEVFVTDTF